MKSGIIEQIKDLMLCTTYMEREHGSHIIGGRCKSFRPESDNPSSLMVNERDWYDFGSGQGGDIIDLAAADKFCGNKGEAIKYLADLAGISSQFSPQISMKFMKYRDLIDDATSYWQTRLGERQMAYLHGRGLTDDTIRTLRIGWADNPCEYLKSKGYTMEQISESGITSYLNRFMIPYLRNGKAVYLVGRASVWEDLPSRNKDAKYMKLLRSDVSEHPIWGAESIRRGGDVVIAEGIFDAISCWQEGFAVVTAVTGAFSAEQKKDLLPLLKNRDVIVCMDYDPETHAGQKFTTALAGELFEAGINVRACYLKGDEYKVDLSAMYAKNPCRKTMDLAFSSAENWGKMEISRIADILSESEKKNELKKFIRKCYLKLDKPTFDELTGFAKTIEKFSSDWLKSAIKSAESAQSELEIVNEFVDKFDCVYQEQIGWHEWRNTVWKRISEQEVRQKVADLYGRHCTSRGVEAVHKLLKARLVRTDLFNLSGECINFPNGMLNIETEEVSDHRRDDFSSIQLNYLYDKDADYPEWRSFLDDITGGDLNRQNLIQEMFGYCLTRDTRYQKAFCLIGGGANGKSVLLSILEAMVGAENTSHVEIAYLQSDFQRIALLSSMVNICNDMKSDVSGTTAFFKAIVAGDPINACYKGKDFVTFRPFCKLVFSANRMITTRDADYSILRRFCFINFPVTFCDDPRGDDQKQKDPLVTERLMKELPGILNWALEGLHHLREQGKFTVTSDQLVMEHDMVLISNPLMDFIEDEVGNGGEYWTRTLQRKEVYERYSKWCDATNSAPLAARGFWHRMRTLFPFEESRDPSGRYVRFINPKMYLEKK